MSGFIVTEKREAVAILKLNRPDALNALNTQVLEELREAFRALQRDDAVRVIVITGEGRAFVAGADIGEMASLNLVEGRKFGNVGQEVFREIERSEKPTIAAINGYALGGGLELALCCDIRLASTAAILGQPEVGLGIIPGFSGTQRLTQLIGKGRAAQMILTTEQIGAEEALAYGLVNKVTEPEKLLEEAVAMAQTIASKAPLAVRWANSAIKRGLEVDIESGIAIEADLFGMCFATADQKEGMAAFLERRSPAFEGK